MQKWIVCAGDAFVIFDTDIFIWIERGNPKAATLVEQEEERFISVQTYLELLQCVQNKAQHDCTKQFLRDFGFRTLPLTETIGHRATVYIEEYSLSHGLRAGDALIAATATENNMTLCSSSAKRFRHIKELKLKVFRL